MTVAGYIEDLDGSRVDVAFDLREACLEHGADCVTFDTFAARGSVPVRCTVHLEAPFDACGSGYEYPLPSAAVMFLDVYAEARARASNVCLRKVAFRAGGGWHGVSCGRNFDGYGAHATAMMPVLVDGESKPRWVSHERVVFDSGIEWDKATTCHIEWVVRMATRQADENALVRAVEDAMRKE